MYKERRSFIVSGVMAAAVMYWGFGWGGILFVIAMWAVIYLNGRAWDNEFRRKELAWTHTAPQGHFLLVGRKNGKIRLAEIFPSRDEAVAASSQFVRKRGERRAYIYNDRGDRVDFRGHSHTP